MRTFLKVFAVVALLMVGGGAWYLFAPSLFALSLEEEQTKIVKALDGVKRANAEVLASKQKEAELRKQLDAARQAEAEAKESGDLAKQRELAEQTKQREAELLKQAELTKRREAQWEAAKKQAQEDLEGGSYEVEKTVYTPPQRSDDEVLVDDKLDDKRPAFDTALVDRRPLGDDGGWLLNASAAVLRLDVPMIKPDVEQRLLTLHPSYAAAVTEKGFGAVILPSVNMLDGKAKQFDDGLYAAIDLAYYQGLKDKLQSQVQLVKRIADKAGSDNAAAPYLAAGLELAGVKVKVANTAEKDRLLSAFRQDEVASKPIGFYTWNEQLKALFRFARFFQRQFGEFRPEDLAVPQALAAILSQDKALLAEYQQVVAFYARLTNAKSCLSLADIGNVAPLDLSVLKRLAKQKNVHHATVAVFPPSTSKESVLFEKLFPKGVPPNVDLMKELVKRIRSGEVDLKPKADSGWYEYQVYALETLLLAEKGVERDKLLLTKEYKKRMLEAFKALVTKRRETHMREMQMLEALSLPSRPPKIEVDVRPRLRIEPAPTYFVRAARAYAFLASFLEATVGKEALQVLRGLKQDGHRAQDLHAELLWIRDLFYGFYLISAEDIGMKASFAADEAVDQERCYQLASDWLAKTVDDADLAADTRVAVPIYIDANRGVTRLWITLGVRLTRLDTNYARLPSIKPAKGEGDWTPVKPHRLVGANYLIPVDEFAEVELKGIRVLSREEFRAICDREKTKEAIMAALQR